MPASEPAGTAHAKPATPADTATVPTRISGLSADRGAADTAIVARLPPSASAASAYPENSGLVANSTLSMSGPYAQNPVVATESANTISSPAPMGARKSS